MQFACVHTVYTVWKLYKSFKHAWKAGWALSTKRVPAGFDVVMLHCMCVLLEMHTIEHAVQLLSYPLPADLFHQGFSYLQAAYSTC